MRLTGPDRADPATGRRLEEGPGSVPGKRGRDLGLGPGQGIQRARCKAVNRLGKRFLVVLLVGILMAGSFYAGRFTSGDQAKDVAVPPGVKQAQDGGGAGDAPDGQASVWAQLSSAPHGTPDSAAPPAGHSQERFPSGGGTPSAIALSFACVFAPVQRQPGRRSAAAARAAYQPGLCAGEGGRRVWGKNPFRFGGFSAHGRAKGYRDRGPADAKLAVLRRRLGLYPGRPRRNPPSGPPRSPRRSPWCGFPAPASDTTAGRVAAT